jgi:Ni2+-binding GTPase involved in maturation of urease and hydrogenase
MLVAGATSSGKTLLVRKILKHFPDLTNTEKKPINVVWAYGTWQKDW